MMSLPWTENGMSVPLTTGLMSTVVRSSRYRLISRMPTGTLRCSSASILAASRCAKGTPRRRMPMKASLSRSALFSRISWARRTSVRSISEALISCAFSRVADMKHQLNTACRGFVLPGEWAHARGPHPVLRSIAMRKLGALLALATAPVFAAEIKSTAGTGKPGAAADGSKAAESPTNNPYGLAVGPDRGLYVCEIDNHRVVRIDLRTGRIIVVAGNGKKGYSGDGGPALEASLNQPYEVLFDKAGNMFFVEMQNHVVRRVDARTRIITTVAGTGKPGFSGDGGPATKAELSQPHSIALDPQGRLLICDIANRRIRRVDLKSGVIETYAGTGERKNPADGAALEGAPLNGPRAIAVDAKGNL